MLVNDETVIVDVYAVNYFNPANESKGNRTMDSKTQCLVCGALKVKTRRKNNGAMETKKGMESRRTCLDQQCKDEIKMRTREKTRAANADWYHVQPCVYERFYLAKYVQ